MTAKLPAGLVKQPERLLSDLQPGESAEIEMVDLLIDAERNCYLRPDAKLLAHPEDISLTVKRTPEGYEVVIPRDERYRWKVWGVDLRRYIPVARITVEGEKT